MPAADPFPSFAPLRRKMIDHGVPDLAVRTFRHYFDQLCIGTTGWLSEAEIEPASALHDLGQLEAYGREGLRQLSACVVIKLNGGLGTGMGLDRAKSLLPARDGLTFLDLAIRQVLSWRERLEIGLPLVFMNSFNTNDDTLDVVRRSGQLEAGQRPIPPSFVQHRVPRLVASSLQAVSCPSQPQREWCPPGHGDLYTALQSSGLIDRLLDCGYHYAFVSNVDNLGATVDPRILGVLAARGLPFLMEVTDRTVADRKGGHLALRDGRLVLREIAQCPPDELDQFQDIERYRFFNTNNLWLDLRALKQVLGERNGVLGLPLIRNVKPLDPADPSSEPVIQVETAMGSAIEVFAGAEILRVPRRRFTPVKTTADLLALWSDRFRTNLAGEIVPLCESTLKIELDARFYRSMSDFEQRFPAGAPALRQARSLSIQGDIVFANNIEIRGDVHLVNRSARPRRIAAGSIVQDIDESMS